MSGASYAVGDLVEATVGPVAHGGHFVARVRPPGAERDVVVFVRHALEGERVRIRVTEVDRTFLRGDAVEVLTPSPHRVDAPCALAHPDGCGGCDFQHVALAHQRALKGAVVREQLQRLAGVDREVVVEPVPVSGRPDDGLGWRTRMQYVPLSEGRVGLRKHRSHDVEPIDRCLIASAAVEEVGAERLVWSGAASVEVAAEGAQRVVSVWARRRGSATVPSVEAGVVVDGRPVRVPHGLVHSVLGRRFEVAAGGFWQVHERAPAVLWEAVREGLGPRPGERVVDLYSGVGLFASLLGSVVGPSGSVLAVEGSARACADAARNTDDQPWVRIRTSAVTPALVSRLSADLVVLDPPRAGAGLEVSAALAALRPRALAYVSCDPATFARDLKVFVSAGWSVSSLRAFDLYPQTEHVELVTVLVPPS